MNIFDFENRLKSHTSNSRGEVDIDRLLGDLNIKPQTRSNRRYIYFFITSLVLVGLGCLAISDSFSTKQDHTKNIAAFEVDPTSTQIDKEEKLTTILTQTSQSEKTTTLKKKSEVNKSDISKLNTSSHTTKNAQTLNSNVKHVAPKKEVNRKDQKQTSLGTSAKDVKTEQSKLVVSKFIATSNKEILNTESKENTTSSNRSDKPVGLLPSPTVSILYSEERIINKNSATCPRFGTRLWHLSIIPEIGYTFPMKTLSLDGDEANRFVFTERLAHESTIEGINASLYFQFKNHITGLYVKPGVSYARFTERIDFVRRDQVFDTTTVVIDGMTEIEITQRDTALRFQPEYELHQFELPVALGYSLNFKQFSIDIEGGIRLNIFQRATGQILTNEGDFLDLDNENVDLFKSSVGLGFFGGVNFKKQLNSRTEFYVAPRFSFNTLSYSSNSNPINQRYSVVGLHAGLIYAIQ